MFSTAAIPFNVGDTWKFHRVYDWCSSMSPERAYGEVIAIDVNPWNSAATTVCILRYILVRGYCKSY